MNANCRSFRLMLERALEGGCGPDELTNLSWHEHLLACGSCRALLESEEALELLLSTLPEPRLPPRLTRRVLARLRAGEEVHTSADEAALDRLLELDAQARAPSDLARRVLANLEDERALPVRSAAEEARLDALLGKLPPAEMPPDLARRVSAHLAEERALSRRRHVTREAALDRLLERAGTVESPAGLSRRVLAALSSARRPATLRGLRGGRFSERRTRVLLAAAASLAIALTLWALWPRHDALRREDELAQLPGGRVDTRLLENLDVLEEWELLDSGNVDILLSTLPVADQWLLELGSEAGAPAPEKLEKEGPKPKKG